MAIDRTSQEPGSKLVGRQLTKKKEKQKTYNTGDSLVVTDPITDPALTGLSMGERTGSRVLQWVWSYVMGSQSTAAYIVAVPGCHSRH